MIRQLFLVNRFFVEGSPNISSENGFLDALVVTIHYFLEHISRFFNIKFCQANFVMELWIQ